MAVWYPLQVILAILGLPEGDYPRMLKLTQELFGGVKIAKGDWLYLSYLAANRDPKMFPNPHAFDIDRPNADNTSRSVSGRTFVWLRNSPVWRCEACFASSSPASNT